jgi:hypothetical protein
MYHITPDNLCPLKASDDGRMITVDSSVELDDRKYTDCHEIVIVTAFPLSNMAI